MKPEEIYQDCKAKWGRQCQIIAAIEELNEAAGVLARHLNDKCTEDDVLEELADAEIMLDQMKYYFDAEGIARFKQYKLNRLAENLINVPLLVKHNS